MVLGCEKHPISLLFWIKLNLFQSQLVDKKSTWVTTQPSLDWIRTRRLMWFYKNQGRALCLQLAMTTDFAIRQSSLFRKDAGIIPVIWRPLVSVSASETPTSPSSPTEVLCFLLYWWKCAFVTQFLLHTYNIGKVSLFACWGKTYQHFMVLHKEHDRRTEHQPVQGLCHLDKFEGWLSGLCSGSGLHGLCCCWAL